MMRQAEYLLRKKRPGRTRSDTTVNRIEGGEDDADGDYYGIGFLDSFLYSPGDAER